jgi:hypothetical protein
MSLDEAQRKKVAEWVSQGLKLSAIQNQLASELGVTMTYMEVRFLVDDLKLNLKDAEPVKAPASPLASPAAQPMPSSRQASKTQPEAPKAPGTVSITVDQIARPGAVVSGQVTFTDGNTAAWLFDQMGQLRMMPQKNGYRPPAADLQQFQAQLETELARLGY